MVERGNEVGQTWAHFYDSLVLHTPLRLSALPGLAFPPGTPLFPRRLDYLKYLCKYAEAFAVPLRLGTGVVELRRLSNSWYARTADGAELSARAVVVATGIASQPHVPDLPGREHFEGGVLHSAEYRRPEPFTGRRVLVVGAGNSAADISVELSRAGIEVTLAVRSGATVVPLHVAGIPVQYLAVAVAPLPRGAQRALARAGAALGRPAVLPWAPIGDCSGVPVTGGHLPDALRSGAVRLKGSVTELVANGVRFADHDVLPIDTIILATGYPSSRRASRRFRAPRLLRLPVADGCRHERRPTGSVLRRAQSGCTRQSLSHLPRR